MTTQRNLGDIVVTKEGFDISGWQGASLNTLYEGYKPVFNAGWNADRKASSDGEEANV